MIPAQLDMDVDWLRRHFSVTLSQDKKPVSVDHDDSDAAPKKKTALQLFLKFFHDEKFPQTFPLVTGFLFNRLLNGESYWYVAFFTKGVEIEDLVAYQFKALYRLEKGLVCSNLVHHGDTVSVTTRTEQTPAANSILYFRCDGEKEPLATWSLGETPPAAKKPAPPQNQGTPIKPVLSEAAKKAIETIQPTGPEGRILGNAGMPVFSDNREPLPPLNLRLSELSVDDLLRLQDEVSRIILQKRAHVVIEEVRARRFQGWMPISQQNDLLESIVDHPKTPLTLLESATALVKTLLDIHS